MGRNDASVCEAWFGKSRSGRMLGKHIGGPIAGQQPAVPIGQHAVMVSTGPQAAQPMQRVRRLRPQQK
jgi:hypothetical protein